jgi:hypothetical protein
LTNNTLPHRNDDQMMALYSHYFSAADLMLENYLKFQAKQNKKGSLTQREFVDQRIFLCTWLGFLGVTCEGFRQLGMRLFLINKCPSEFHELVPKLDEIGKLMKQHDDALREFRNSVFHLRQNLIAVHKFFASGVDHLAWARDLHRLIDRFFSEYRVVCEVHYVMNNRYEESQIRRGRRRVVSLL